MIETNRIEFKRQLTRDMDIEKEVVAFLNYREGGIIYVGIDDKGKPVENPNIDDNMLQIKNRLRDNILPSPMGLFDVTVERIDEVPVVRVFVSSGSEKPYYKKQYGLSPKGCFMRVGTSAEPMTQEDFFNGVSNPRNKELMRVFRDVELVESLGTGLQRVLKSYGRECFIFMDHFIRVVIPYAWLPKEKDYPEDTNTIQKTIQKTIRKDLSTVQKTMVEYLAAHPNATQKEMARDITIVSLGGVKYNLQVLQKRGYLRRVGPDKGGHWEIIE